MIWFIHIIIRVCAYKLDGRGFVYMCNCEEPFVHTYEGL